jgi:putative phage-type endonuclease
MILYCATEADWLQQRKNFVTASDVATLFGINPYKSAYTLWAEKRGLVESDPATIPTRVGHALEPLIARLYMEETGLAVIDPGDYTMYTTDLCPLACTPDRLIMDGEQIARVVELKSMGERAAANIDGARLDHQVQLQAQLLCTGATQGDLAVLVGNRQFSVYPFERHEKICAQIVERVNNFWYHVISGEPPEVDGSVSTADTLKKMHPDDNGEAVEVNPDTVENIHRLQSEIENATQRLLFFQNCLKEELGNNTIGICEGSSITWKTEEKKEYSVKASKSRKLRVRRLTKDE